jgi:hypothetical protein
MSILGKYISHRRNTIVRSQFILPWQNNLATAIQFEENPKSDNQSKWKSMFFIFILPLGVIGALNLFMNKIPSDPGQLTTDEWGIPPPPSEVYTM